MPIPRSPLATATPAPGCAYINRRCLLLLVLVFALGLAPAANAADFSWNGEGSASANTWSNGANWTGGTAPAASSSIGALAFPVLNRSACNPEPPTEACFTAVNDLTGLSVNELQIDDADAYSLSGDGFTLGSGGLSTTNFAGSGGFATIATPITLGADQTWNISGSVSGGDGVNVRGALSGSSAALTVNLTQSALFDIGGFTPSATDNEVGNVQVQSTSNGSFWLDAPLNASDGHSLIVQGVTFYPSGASVGALEVLSSTTKLGWRASEATTLAATSATFNGGALDIPITGTGTQPDVDYSRLVSTGPVELIGTTLDISDDSMGGCPTVPAGQTDTLVSTTGTLTGTFSNAPGGSIITTECLSQFRINYNTTSSPQTVTATAVASEGGGGVPVNTQPPTISGSASEGQTLSESQGSWSNSPMSYADQWQRCDPSGNNCQAITGAIAPTYTLTATDVGSTIRVQEIASNGEGGSEPVVSAQTAVVQATSTGGSRNNGGGTSGGTASGGSSGGSTSSGGGTTATISSAQIAASLGSQLIPSGKAARITALLKSGGVVMSFKALEAGTLSVQWYEVPSGANLAEKTKAKPVLIASGQTSFAAAGISNVKIRLTAQGRKLLKHVKKVKLEIKGVFVVKMEAGINVTKVMVLRGA
jgi:hypothetical protein